MDDSVSAIVRTAVTVARAERISRLSTLRQWLLEMFPESSADVEAALAFWVRSRTT